MINTKVIGVGIVILGVLCLLILGSSVVTGNFVLQKKSDAITIAMTDSVTGSRAMVGVPIKEGVEAAFRDAANQQHEFSVNFVSMDDAGDAVKAVSNYQFAKEDTNIFISVFTPLSAPIAPLAERDNKILFYLSTAVNLAKDNAYVFKSYFNVGEDARVVAKLVKGESTGLVYNLGDHGESFRTTMQEVAGEYIVYESGYVSGEKDFRTPLLKLKESTVQSVVFFGLPDACTNFLVQAKEIGYVPKNIGLLGCPQESVVQMATSSASLDTNVYFVNSFSDFNFDYKFGYGVGETILKGMDACVTMGKNASDAECLKNTLTNLSFEGRFGHIATDEFGLTRVDAKLYRADKGKLVLVD